MRVFVGLGVTIAIMMIAFGLVASRVAETPTNNLSADDATAAGDTGEDSPNPTMSGGNSRQGPANPGEQDVVNLAQLDADERCFRGNPSVETVLSGRTIIVDPGHGGEDLGTVSRHTGLTESELVLRISRMLRDRLVSSGANVCLTRVSDVYVRLADRANFANERNGDAFVSIHLNSLPDASENYAMTMWGNEAKDRFLAERLLEALRFGMATPPYHNGQQNPMSPNVYRIEDLDSNMLKSSEMPAALVEASFLSNRWEAEAFLSGIQDGTHWREQQVADVVHDGLVDFFEVFR